MTEARDLRRRTDEELVVLIREAAPGAAARAETELFGRYRGRVYAWCRRYVREHEAALDLAQDVLLIAYRSLGTYQQRAPFGGWLFTVTHHACLRAVRRRTLETEEDSLLETIADPRPDALAQHEDAQARDRLLTLVRATLEPIEQRALWLRVVEAQPVEEITRMLGLENATGARALLQKARRKLRAALERQRLDDEGARP